MNTASRNGDVPMAELADDSRATAATESWTVPLRDGRLYISLPLGGRGERRLSVKITGIWNYSPKSTTA